MRANSCRCISDVVFIGWRASVDCFGEPAQRRSECRRAWRGPDVHFKRYQLKNSTLARTSSVYRHTQTQTHRGTYLICVVKAVIHEPRDQRRLSHCKRREEEKRCVKWVARACVFRYSRQSISWIGGYASCQGGHCCPGSSLQGLGGDQEVSSGKLHF